MYELGSGQPYENLDMQARRPTLSTRRANGESICELGPEMIKIEETRPEFTIDEFIGVVMTVLRGLGNDCPPFFLQRCQMQCLLPTARPSQHNIRPQVLVPFSQ